MAGGTCTDKPGIFDNVKEEWSYHRQCQFKNRLDNKLLSDTFYKRRKVEYKRTCTRNISLFQKNIFRILSGCHNTDLYIIHDTNVIKTNCCIFKTRSPSLYNVLEYFFFKNGKPIKCYLNTVQAFQRIDNFVRLLYINTDLSREENTLLNFFSNEKNCIKSEFIKSDENDVSTSSSEMADSGLETGSLSLNENTESENSSTDIEESHVNDYIPTDDGFIRLNCDADKSNDKNKCVDSKACGSSSLMARQFDQKYLSNNNGDDEEEEDEEEEITNCDNVDDVSRYENEVLNDIFYESDGNDNEQSASFIQTRSFEFIEPENLSSSSSMPIGATNKNITTVDLSKEFISENNYQDEKTSTIPQTRSMIVENIQHELSHSNDNSLNKSSSSVNNYYFIDASSLNDETEVASITSTSQQPIYMESLNYIPSKSQNSNDQTNKIISRSSSSSSHQCGHDEVAEFERELKLTETLEPLVEQRKVKRVDSITDDKKIEKELLVVEIKEADSGESNHPSPCIDNNKRLQQCEKSSNIINENTNDSRRSSLIRGDTFELEPGDKKLTNARQEHERRQGNLVFSNSIPQYSGHRVDGDSVSDRTSNYSSMSSYFPIESSSSNNSIDKLKYQKTNHHDFMSYDGDLNNFNDPKYPMIKSASDKFLVDYTEINDNTIGDCISLPMTFDDPSHFVSIKKTKCDETTPIVSGGACTNDYLQSVIDSPVTIRRKTESTPIVSGGSVIMTSSPLPPPTTTTTTTAATATSSTQDKIKSINRLSSSMTTWVVDMSDCTKTNQKSNPTSPNMSKSLSTNESCSSKQINHTKTPDKPNSLGFFINLNDIDNPSMSKTIKTTKKDQNFINKQSFFIDLSSGNNDDKKTKKYQNNISNDCGKLQHDKNEKKNIFSMFIDLNDTKGVKSNEREIKSLNSLHQGHRSITDDDIGKSDSSKELRSSTDKKGVFMFIESDSPVVRRRTLSTSRPAFKRHSWNMEKSHQQLITTTTTNGNSNGSGNGHINRDTIFRREHKRAHSVSIDPDIHMKLSAKKSDSSMSLNYIGKATSLNIPETSQELIQSEINNDQIYYEIRDTPPNSHIEIINDDLRGRVMNQEYKELVRSDCMYSSTDASCDAKILDDERSDISMWEKTPTESTDCHTRKSETFDISSGGGSGPSPESDNNDFDLIEYHSDIINQVDQLHTTKISEAHKSLTEKIKKIECEFDDDKLKIMSKSDNTKDKQQQNNKASCSGFVRLSDLDKTPTDDSIKATTVSNNISYRMSKSIPETSWIESKLAINRTVIGPSQIRTLSSRKYSTIMSTSLPAKNNKSPSDEFTSSVIGGGNEMPSESDLSSMQSSMGKSCASTEETETSSIIATKPYNRLGEDLLRMFIEEINPDVTIDVGGQRIRAHKCILSSRCQYFAAILSGSWIENAGNVITLQGYSYNSVHFALCHIYSGESNIPDTISIVELATLADMLCLEGLKEIIGYTLKVKYCHLFHKPCQICTVGVLECMPLAAAYGLDEVYRKSLRWITRHFIRIWPCKAFASLPKELMDKCYQQHIVHMSPDNILQTIMDCDKLLATLPNVRWAEPVFRMVSNLLEIALKYLSDNFSSILGNDNFQALGRDLTWNISRLEDNILSCADKLLPDQACKSYSRISKMILSIPSDDSIIKPQWNILFIELLKKIQIRVEKCLIKDAARAARTTTWLKMDLELRRKIQELACLVILPNETIKRPTRHSNFMKDIKTPPNRTSASRSLDLRRVKMTITDQVDLKKTTTKSSISQIKNIMTKPKTDPLERKMQTTKIGQTIETNIRPKSWPNKLEVKSRYLEPRTKSVPKENPSINLTDKTIVQQRRKNLISSSDSSRTSSPAMKRAVAAAVAVGAAVNANKKPITRLKMSIKKDVKALSTDSLTETSTNNKSKKKDTLSKSCGITRPESPSLKSKNSTIDIDISTDSLAEIKKKPITTIRKNGKMDNSISADSLDQHKTPKTNIAIKKSPILNKTTTGGKSQILERTKNSLSSSPPINQKNPLSLTNKRPARSVESSTAASRNRAAATTTIFHGSPSLRRSLLDAAKTPDIPSKNINGLSSKINSRQSTPSTSTPTAIKKDIFNPPRSESPNKKSPKLNGTTTRTTRPINAGRKTLKGIEDKLKNKCLVTETLGSRSGTFLKDEPTVLKKSDMKSTQVTSLKN